MPCTKEAFLKQTTECRVRVKFLLDLKNDVVACVEDACRQLLEQLPGMEDAAETANSVQLKKMTQTLRNARKVLKAYEDGLERVRLIYEDDDLDFDDTASCVDSSLPHQNGQSTPLLLELSTVEVKPPPEMASNTVARTTEFTRPTRSGIVSGTDPARPESPVAAAPEPSIVVAAGPPPIVAEVKPSIVATAEPSIVAATKPSIVAAPEASVGAESSAPALAPAQQPQEAELLAPEPAQLPVTTEAHVQLLPTIATPQEAEPSLPASAAAMANGDADCRKHVVSKGNGKEECCQRSIDLIASRTEPIRCSVSHVESPSFFWIQLLINSAAEINEELNFELETDKKALSNPKVGDYCVAPVEDDDDNMHRAKILEIKDNNLGTSFSKILYIDTGKVEWVATKALLELPRRYRHYLRQACPCALADLQPDGDVWTEDVVNKFCQLCACDETSQLYVTALDQGGSPDINTVTLYRVKNNDMTKKETILISLIKAAVREVRRAERVVPMNAIEKEGGESIGGRDPPDVTEGWRCIVRVLESDAANGADDIEERTQERMAKLETLQAALAERAASTITPGEIRQVPLHEYVVDGSDNIYFHVVEAISPSNFYIQTRDANGNNEALDALMTEMNTFYSNPVNRMLVSHTRPNQPAVALSTRDGVTAYRRIVIKDWRVPRGTETRDIRVHSFVNAIFVDYGYCERLQGKDVFILDERFCRLPAQAAFCRLFEIRPTTVDGVWDQNGIDIFKHLTTEGQPLMKAWLCSEKQPYELIMSRKESDGEWTCINRKMVESQHARSDMDFL